MSLNYPVITIDGPSSSGKTTLCRAIAKELKWNILDSGAIYRVLAFSALYHKININSEAELSHIASTLKIKFKIHKHETKVIFEEKDITEKIKSQKISNIASKIAILPLVRKNLLLNQRSFRKLPGLIANGRDMGTVVFVDAFVKIFLHASLLVRTQRRMQQFQNNGMKVNFKDLLLELHNRDERDRTRKISPLKPDKSAILLDSTKISINKIIDITLEHIWKKIDLLKY